MESCKVCSTIANYQFVKVVKMFILKYHTDAAIVKKFSVEFKTEENTAMFVLQHKPWFAQKIAAMLGEIYTW